MKGNNNVCTTVSRLPLLPPQKGVLHHPMSVCCLNYFEIFVGEDVFLFLKIFMFSFRSYWVGSVNWSPGGLFLACVLKRGSLLMLARLGGLLTLTSSGCNVDFGPAHFLPLHPLVTYRYTVNSGTFHSLFLLALVTNY